MDYIKLDDGSKINKKFFEERLEELKLERWELKRISELEIDHVNCELTFETISQLKSKDYYESDKGSIISTRAYKKYFKESCL